MHYYISLRWNHELDANIQPLEMEIVMMKTTMQNATMMVEIATDHNLKKVYAPNVNVLTMTAPNYNANVLTHAMNDVYYCKNQMLL